ncbi:MAG: hypothetical protein U0270_01010 [Labilithrix sp.]
MRARVIGALAVVGLIVVACGGSAKEGKTPSGARASCAADSDCVVSDHAACCKACPDQPFGMPSLNHAQMENKCAVVECSASSDRIECPKVEPKDLFVAICKEGTCAVKKK